MERPAFAHLLSKHGRRGRFQPDPVGLGPLVFSFRSQGSEIVFKFYNIYSGKTVKQLLSEPAPALEIYEHGQGDDQGRGPDAVKSVWPFGEGDELEIHAINPDQKSQRHKDGGDNGQDFHHRVHAVGDAGEIDVNHPGEHVSQGLDGVDNLDGVVVDIAEKGRDLGSEQGRLVALE